MKIKICGITSSFIANKAIKYGADALGFVFAPSKRQISRQDAKNIITKLPKNVLKIGVFVNEQPSTIANIVKDCQLDLIQLHGDENLKDYEQFKKRIIKGVNISCPSDLIKATNYEAEYILLDSKRGKYFGGTGKNFDWHLVEKYNFKNKNIILAGGLTVDNVQTAIRLVKPVMVDVSSSVETKGKKDPEKIKQFIKAVRKECRNNYVD